MLERAGDDRLSLKSLSMQIMLGDLFEKCKNEREAQWLFEELSGMVECAYDEKLEEF